jgi:hypothetical protein
MYVRVELSIFIILRGFEVTNPPNIISGFDSFIRLRDASRSQGGPNAHAVIPPEFFTTRHVRTLVLLAIRFAPS